MRETPSPTPSHQGRGNQVATQELQRQLVLFSFYRIDRRWLERPREIRQREKAEFLRTLDEFKEKVIMLSYSLLGLRADTDFLLWRIAFQAEDHEAMTAAMLRTGLGPFLIPAHSFLAMTKRSIYVDRHRHPGQESSRTVIVPGTAKYLFIYPFVKSREWYLLPKERRQEIMDRHIAVGHRYPSVKINTTYSFGLDDQDFVVAFETDSPADFLDLVMELRETESSRYTVRDTPIFTCISKPLAQILEAFC